VSFSSNQTEIFKNLFRTSLLIITPVLRPCWIWTQCKIKVVWMQRKWWAVKTVRRKHERACWSLTYEEVFCSTDGLIQKKHSCFECSHTYWLFFDYLVMPIWIHLLMCVVVFSVKGVVHLKRFVEEHVQLKTQLHSILNLRWTTNLML